MTTIAERVARGAAYLDGREPGWWQRIDLDALNLRSSCNCILGQLDSDPRHTWGETVEAFGLDYDDSEEVDLGFTTGLVYDSWAHLTDAWRALITERRAVS